MLCIILLELFNLGSLFQFNFRPKDSRMWNAMGNCFEKMEKKNEASKCYERAENCKDKEGIS